MEPSRKQAPSIPFQLQAYSQCFLLQLNHLSLEQVCFSSQDHHNLFNIRIRACNKSNEIFLSLKKRKRIYILTEKTQL